jgi:prolyl-tRNA editing enzyme YbaK/EbsC (Cys-tRNA(Pro) deacylase)
MADAVQRFREASEILGFIPDVRTMEKSTHTAEEAAAAVGCEVGAIVKSLVFLADDEPLLVLVSGPNRVDTDALGRKLGAVIAKSDAKRVKEATGYSIGGVPPFGHPVTLRTVIDSDLLSHDQLWAAAGSATAVFPVSADSLVELTGGEVVSVS